MAVTFHLDNLMDVLARGLRQLGIESCYVALYEGSDRPASEAGLVMAYDEGQRTKINALQTVCSMHNPGGLIKSWHFLE